MKFSLLTLTLIACCGALAQLTDQDLVHCHDSTVYQNPLVYGGLQTQTCPTAVPFPSRNSGNRKTVQGYTKYGICDYETMKTRATHDAWIKCGRPQEGVLLSSEWHFQCLDHTPMGDSGATAKATFTCPY